ncbi:MAG: YIP1 family protein, partial [Salinivirgaceae bacterium]|nr:YIP1 family protein [Salinivirgaceae bacterium]
FNPVPFPVCGSFAFVFYLSDIAIYEILPFFHSKKNKTKSFALVTYSMTPILLALIFSGLIPKLATLIYFIGFYSVFLFWISSAAIIDMTKERRQIFVPLSLLLIMIIFLLLRIVLGAIFSL